MRLVCAEAFENRFCHLARINRIGAHINSLLDFLHPGVPRLGKPVEGCRDIGNFFAAAGDVHPVKGRRIFCLSFFFPLFGVAGHITSRVPGVAVRGPVLRRLIGFDIHASTLREVRFAAFVSASTAKSLILSLQTL